MRTDEEVLELIENDFNWLFANYVLRKAEIIKSAGVDPEWDLVVKVKFFIAPDPLAKEVLELSEFTTNSEESK